MASRGNEMTREFWKLPEGRSSWSRIAARTRYANADSPRNSLHVPPRLFVRRANFDDFRGTQPVLIGGAVSITQLQVVL